MLNLQLSNTLLKAGINVDDYSGHSFRCGGATFAMKSGVPFPLIKCQGDWVSNAYEQHLKTMLHNRLIAIAMTARAIKSICNSKPKGFNFHHSLLGVWRVAVCFSLG